MSNSTIRLLSTLCLAVGLGGCATVTTRPIASADRHDPASSFNATAAKPGMGIAYFLPRQLAQVTIQRTKTGDVPAPKNMIDAIKAQAKAQGALDAAIASVREAQAGVASAENAIIAADSTPADGLAILDERRKDQQIALASAQADLAKAQADFTIATDAIKALSAPPGGTVAAAKRDYQVTVQISLLPPSADPAYGFRLDPRHSWLRDDTHKLTVSSTGLLATSNIVAVDRTGDVIVALAQAVGAIGTLVGGPLKPPTNCEVVFDKVTLIVDFASSYEVNESLNSKLYCMGARFQIVSSNPRAPQFPSQSEVAFNGIAYRTPVEQWVYIQLCAKTEIKDCNPLDTSAIDTANPMWRTSQVVALNLPQAGPISYLRQDAGFLTRTTYDAAFQDGMLTSYGDDRPSEAIQLAGLPIRVIDGVFDGISHVISLRTGVAKAKAGLSQTQKDQVTAQYDLLAARIKGSATISDSQKMALESQVALAKAELSGEGSLADARAALLQQQNNLLIAQTNSPTQVLDNEVSDTVKALKAQAKLEQVQNCLATQRAANQPIDSCVE